MAANDCRVPTVPDPTRASQPASSASRVGRPRPPCSAAESESTARVGVDTGPSGLDSHRASLWARPSSPPTIVRLRADGRPGRRHPPADRRAPGGAAPAGPGGGEPRGSSQRTRRRRRPIVRDGIAPAHAKASEDSARPRRPPARAVTGADHRVCARAPRLHRGGTWPQRSGANATPCLPSSPSLRRPGPSRRPTAAMWRRSPAGPRRLKRLGGYGGDRSGGHMSE